MWGNFCLQRQGTKNDTFYSRINGFQGLLLSILLSGSISKLQILNFSRIFKLIKEKVTNYKQDL